MSTAARLIRPKEIGAHHRSSRLRHKHQIRVGEPIRERRLALKIPLQSIGLARPNHRFQDRPNRLAILLARLANLKVHARNQPSIPPSP